MKDAAIRELEMPSSESGPVDMKAAEDSIRAFLRALRVELPEESWENTPRRMAKAYAEILRPEPFLSKVFETAHGFDGLVVVRGIRFASVCEHHLLPFVGIANIAYRPNAGVVGLSKLARCVAHAAARPQIQERLTQQILDWLSRTTGSDDVGVRIEARHSCMSLRGARAADAEMVTQAFRGSIDPGELRNS